MSRSYKQQGSLTALFGGQARRRVETALRHTTRDVGDDVVRNARDLTPKRTGDLADEWRAHPVEDVPDGHRVIVDNPSPVAHLVEKGTDRHRIGPELEQAISTPEGPRVGADHPGTEGQHILPRALAMTEGRVDTLARRHLDKMAREIETLATTDDG